MNILLVDDEYAVREALEVMIDWKEYGITEVLYAENGLEALGILQQKEVDIMFCDMEMPKMNGIQLLEEMKAQDLKTKVVAISGYTEFSYVKSTLQAGGLDYILKPIVREEIISALQKAISKRQEDIDKERNKIRDKNVKEEVSLSILREWISGKTPYNPKVEHALLDLHYDPNHLSISLLVLQNPEQVCEMLFEGDHTLMRFALNNVIREILGNQSCHLIHIDDYLQVILTDGLEQRSYNLFLDQFQSFCDQFYHLSFISERNDQMIQATDVVKEVDKLKHLLLDRQVPNTKTTGKKVLSFDIDKQLHAALTERNMEGINRLLDSYCEELESFPMLTYRDIQMQTIEANYMLNRMIHQQSVKDNKTLEPMSIWVFTIKIWKESLRHRLYQLMEYQEESKLNIESVYRYLQEHYPEAISIDTLTEHFFQSPQYISKRFKERYGMTIVSVLRDIRMEHAKRYLETTGLPIVEIAKLTGYEDENYFGKVFKKEVGMSPKQYRSERAGNK